MQIKFSHSDNLGRLLILFLIVTSLDACNSGISSMNESQMNQNKLSASSQSSINTPRSVFYGTSNGEIRQYINVSTTKSKVLNEGIPVVSITRSTNGAICAGTLDGHIWQYNGVVWQEQADSPLVEDHSDLIWGSCSDEVGNIGNNGVAFTWNGSDWNSLGPAPVISNGVIKVATQDNNGNIYVGGIDSAGAGEVYAFQLGVWLPILSKGFMPPISNGYISSLIVESDGVIYAGGHQDSGYDFGSGGQVLRYFVNQPNIGWSTLGGGFGGINGNVTALAESGNSICMAAYGKDGESSVTSIMCFNGYDTWTPVGDNPSRFGEVHALLVDPITNDFYAATDYGVIFSRGGLSQWIPFISKTIEPITSMLFAN